MGSRQVHVRVFSGSREVASADARPVRVLPTREAGVVYGGEVYRLYRGDLIDLSDEPFHKSDCTEWVPPNAEIPYASRTPPQAPSSGVARLSVAEADWYVESNRFGHYLVFNAAEADAAALVDILDERLGVRRWGESYRAADNGQRYDWFARLRLSPAADRDEVLAQVQGVLSAGRDPAPTGGEPLSAPDIAAVPEGQRAAIVDALTKALRAVQAGKAHQARAEDLQNRIDELAQRHSQLLSKADSVEADLRLAEDRAQRLDQRIAELEVEARERDQARGEAIHRAQEENSRLRTALSDAQAAAAASRTDEQEIASLVQQLTEERNRSDAAEALMEEAAAESAALHERVATLQSRVDDKQRELERLETDNQNLAAQLGEYQEEARENRTRRRESSRARDRRLTVEGFLDEILEPVDLPQDSVETLLSFQKPARAVRYLTMIANSEAIPGVDHGPLRGYPGWREITNVHTGDPDRPDMGRIYYRPSREGTKTLIHKKVDDSEQQRFLRRCLG